MSTKTLDVQDARLFSYVIASSDMRYVEVNERELYLRNDPDLGPVVRGEVPGCGPACDANLNQVLLEYALSCENCRNRTIAAQTATSFGQRLGKVLVLRIYQDAPEMPGEDRVQGAFEVILNSMKVPYESDLTAGYLRFDLAYSPLHQTIGDSGFTLGLDMAGLAFVALCQSMLHILAPGWELLIPAEDESDAPLRRIHISRQPAGGSSPS
jgi:hypothetical protein